MNHLIGRTARTISEGIKGEIKEFNANSNKFKVVFTFSKGKAREFWCHLDELVMEPKEAMVPVEKYNELMEYTLAFFKEIRLDQGFDEQKEKSFKDFIKRNRDNEIKK